MAIYYTGGLPKDLWKCSGLTEEEWNRQAAEREKTEKERALRIEKEMAERVTIFMKTLSSKYTDEELEAMKQEKVSLGLYEEAAFLKAVQNRRLNDKV
jgi:hypothetical protein